MDLDPIVNEILASSEPLTLVDRWWLQQAGLLAPAPSRSCREARRSPSVEVVAFDGRAGRQPASPSPARSRSRSGIAA